MFTLNTRYLFYTAILFVVEVVIALFVHDSIIRPYVGDYLVVILLFCFVKSFVNAASWKVALGVLLFSYIIEFLQYLHFLKWIGWENNKMARIVLGHGFEWIDI